LLRSALITCLEKYDISVDGTGEALGCLEGKALEMTDGTVEDQEEGAERQLQALEGVKGGNRGQLAIFNTNHIGKHKFSGVMLVSCSRCDATSADGRSCFQVGISELWKGLVC
jgi:hypothetical protein